MEPKGPKWDPKIFGRSERRRNEAPRAVGFGEKTQGNPCVNQGRTEAVTVAAKPPVSNRFRSIGPDGTGAAGGDPSGLFPHSPVPHPARNPQETVGCLQM